MKTGKRTTYILLERGSEDTALITEIMTLTDNKKITTKEMATKYPTLLALYQGLRDEIEVVE